MSAPETTLASFTRPDPDAPDHPLGLIRTLERAQEFLEAGETADTRAAIQGALEKAREAQSQGNPDGQHTVEDRVRAVMRYYPDLGEWLLDGRISADRALISDAIMLSDVIASAASADEGKGGYEPCDGNLHRAVCLLNTLLRMTKGTIDIDEAEKRGERVTSD